MLVTIFSNLIPLYVLIGLGFIAGRYCDVNLHSVARILNFFFMPAVFTGAIMRLDIPAQYIALPMITSALSFTIVFFMLHIARRFWQDGTEYLLASASVNCNAMYFGLPIVAALFGAQGVSLYVLLNLGGAINNISLSYYLSARGRLPVREALQKLLKFPAIYGVIIGALLNLADIQMTDVVEKYWSYSVGSVTLLGMMMIGVAVSKLDGFEICFKQLSALFAMKYLIWPLGLCGAALLDYSVFHFFEPRIYALMALLSVMPMTANVVAYAAENDLYPQRAGTAVLVSSAFSAIMIPLAYLVISMMGWVS